MSSASLKRLVSCERQQSIGRLPYVGLEDVGSATGTLVIASIPEPVEAPLGLTFQPGDVLFGKLRPYLAKSFLAQFRGCCSSEFLVLRSKSRLEPRFLSYIVQSRPFVEWANTTSDGAKMPRSDWEAVGAFRTWLPSPGGQRLIADFLDAETTRIDTLTRARQRTIQLLDERRAALIEMQTARSGGVPMRLRWLLSSHITDGPHETPNFLDQGVPFLSAEQIVDNSLDFDHCLYVSSEAHEAYSRKCKPQAGDVLVCKTGATIGKVAAVETQRAFSIWSPLALLRPDTRVLRTRYLWYSLQGAGVQQQIRLAATQSTQPNISMPDLGDLTVCLPPLTRQDSVVGNLDEALTAAGSLKHKLELQVALLLERRYALISAAVTGQIAIPGAA
jgi:type I restriction enzyme, S subunit